MNDSKYGRDISIGVFGALIVLIVDQYLTLSESSLVNYFFKPIFLISFLVSVAWKRKLPLFLRVFFTGVFYIWGIYFALLGRTGGVHLTLQTFFETLGVFFFLAYLILIYPLAKIWSGKSRLYIFHLFPMVSIVLALIIASVEERVFVHLNPEGKGPTKRWSVNIAWMAYEPATAESPALLRGNN